MHISFSKSPQTYQTCESIFPVRNFSTSESLICANRLFSFDSRFQHYLVSHTRLLPSYFHSILPLPRSRKSSSFLLFSTTWIKLLAWRRRRRRAWRRGRRRTTTSLYSKTFYCSSRWTRSSWMETWILEWFSGRSSCEPFITTSAATATKGRISYFWWRTTRMGKYNGRSNGRRKVELGIRRRKPEGQRR